MTHEGWSNYQTWLVNLWLDNDHALYLEKAEIMNDAPTDGAAAQLLEQFVRELQPDLGNTVWADLLNSAFDEVNWLEIAKDARASTAADAETETE